ncbi:MAG: hypothetical protein HY717_10955 [Planctomycetes bacterium]|nr:hypothetical protein [Planctomycetota bacterium]
MKHFSLSLVIAAAAFALAGAVFFFRATDHPEGQPTPSAGAGKDQLQALLEAQRAFEDQLAQLGERLGRLEAATAGLESALKSKGAGANAQETAGISPDLASSTEEGILAAEEKELLPAVFKSQEAGGLRDFVKDVIRQEREEYRRQEKRRDGERQKMIEELSKGPFGKLNLRVNLMANTLDLSEFQKQRYYEILSDYSARYGEIRKGINKEDPEAFKIYSERKRQFEEEFDGVVLQTLTPPQAQNYQKIPEFARSASPEAAIEAMPKVVFRAMEESGDGVVRLLPKGEEGAAPAGEEGARAGAARTGRVSASKPAAR